MPVIPRLLLLNVIKSLAVLEKNDTSRFPICKRAFNQMYDDTYCKVCHSTACLYIAFWGSVSPCMFNEKPSSLAFWGIFTGMQTQMSWSQPFVLLPLQTWLRQHTNGLLQRSNHHRWKNITVFVRIVEYCYRLRPLFVISPLFCPP